MSDQAPPRLFLERRSYQSRRLIDALQLLPFLGVLLWLVPLVWPRGTGEDGSGIGIAEASIYIFAVWAALTAISAILVARLSALDDDTDTDAEQAVDDGAA